MVRGLLADPETYLGSRLTLEIRKTNSVIRKTYSKIQNTHFSDTEDVLE